jgi:putative transposase
LPLIEKMARKHKRPVGGSWRMDETYIKVKGVWKYLYRAVDKQGKTVDFLLTAKRDITAAKRFFDEAIGATGDPDKVVMDKSGANKTAVDAINAGRAVPILVRQVKYLNNIIEQDYRGFCRIVDQAAEFPVRALYCSFQTDHSCQRRKLVGERCDLDSVNCELALADHVYQFDAG